MDTQLAEVRLVEMAKKKPTDRHQKAATSLRLDDEFDKTLSEVMRKEDRTRKAIIQRALRAYYELHGYWAPRQDGEGD